MGTAVATSFDITLSLDEFKAWLQEQKSKTVVGLARMPKQCPVARFLGRHGLRGNYAVHPTTIGVSHNGEPSWSYFPAPGWVEKFVRAIDRERPLTEITARQALQLLG